MAIRTPDGWIIAPNTLTRKNDMCQSEPFPTTSIWDLGTENPRPHCPRCDMRMILVQRPAPEKHECFRCRYTEPAIFGHHQ